MSATARDQAVDQVNETSQTIANIVPRHFGQRLADFFALCKPRVNTLIVFTAMIGMFLASPGFPPLRLFLFASLGIALVAGAAAAINCLVERTVDALMSRTRWRGTARGTSSPAETLVLALLVGGSGLWILHALVNPLTMWLTLATFVGYAVIYTLLLKPATPMNIVIGGASGAMPPLLGWTAITGQQRREDEGQVDDRPAEGPPRQFIAVVAPELVDVGDENRIQRQRGDEIADAAHAERVGNDRRAAQQSDVDQALAAGEFDAVRYR